MRTAFVTRSLLLARLMALVLAVGVLLFLPVGALLLSLMLSLAAALGFA